MGPPDPVDSELEDTVAKSSGNSMSWPPLADLQVGEHSDAQEMEMTQDAFFAPIVLDERVGKLRGSSYWK